MGWCRVTEAVKWYRLAAEQGNEYGQKNLGVMYEYGRGVGQSLTEAVKWYRLSAEQGLRKGKVILVICTKLVVGRAKSH